MLDLLSRTDLAGVLVFILGLVVGSFLNVVILRYNTRLRQGSGGQAGLLWQVRSWWGTYGNSRSRCFSCGKTLKWYELVPVVSFLLQRGRCRACGSKISWQYPLVELGTAISFALVWLMPQPLDQKIFYLVIFSILIVILAYDWRHQIIPDALVYGFIVLAFFYSLFSNSLISNLLAGLGLAAFFWILWLVSRGRWLGFADGKLALGIGLLLGPVGGVSATILAFWIGAVAGLLLMAISKLSRTHGRVTIKSELPFAPFLILGLVLVLFFQIDVFTLFQI